jgi:hypothetical protein
MAYSLRSTFETRSELNRTISRLRSSVSASPGNASLRLSYASLLYVAGSFGRAKIEARRAIGLGDQDSEIYRLLGRVLYLEGDYLDAMDCFRKVAQSGSGYDDSVEWIVECLLRVNDYAGAAKIIEEHGLDHPQAQLIRTVAVKPAFQLVGPGTTTTVPFVQLDPLPLIEITINGERVHAFLDTGGPGFSTNFEFAKKRGLPVLSWQKGNYASRKNAPVNAVQIDSLSIGKFTLRNVAGFALQGVRPKFGRYVCEACIGTGVLNQFLSTIDYRNRKLILSKRKSPSGRKKHLSSLGRSGTRVPFWMASDHYLIAKGCLARKKGLIFLVDSGLAAFGRPAGEGPLVQAAFMTWYGPLKEHGIVGPYTQVGFPYFYKIRSLGLGALIQHDLCGFVKDRNTERLLLNGIMIDGLSSHAFLRHYRWTIDFDRHEFVFT